MHQEMHSTDEAKAPQPTIKHKKRIHRNTHSILHHPTASHNTYTRRQTPCNEHNIYWDPCDSWEMEGGEKRGDDEGKEGVAYNADGLRERAKGGCYFVE